MPPSTSSTFWMNESVSSGSGISASWVKNRMSVQPWVARDHMSVAARPGYILGEIIARLRARPGTRDPDGIATTLLPGITPP